MDSEQLRTLVDIALRALDTGREKRAGGPAPAVEPAELARQVRLALGRPDGVLPATGAGDAAALAALTELFSAGAVDPAHPLAAAHLHCPPLPVAVAADLVAGLLNQSVDSWDQGPAAITFEREVVRTLAELAGLDPDRADGAITTGGSESNLMGLLLAREAGHTRILCSEHAHFSIQRAAAQLGLGGHAVTPVPTDADYRLDPMALAAALAAEWSGTATVVATVGTTGTGSIDPLPRIADLTAKHRAWLHVDAAYGGGALFSDRLAPLLAGLDRADSIALDLHKIGWQPIPAGVFLVADERFFAPLALNAGYLNPIDDEAAGYHSLLGRSLRTTRRADAFKIAVTLRAVGRAGLGDRLDRCHQLAGYAAKQISGHPRLRLNRQPVLTTVVFRYPAAAQPDQINAELRRRLLRDGRAVVGRTELDGSVWLKLTLLNPDATERDLDTLLAAVVAAGDEAGAALVPGPAAPARAVSS
ncbi:MAG TPA: aminotransferase class I/II-fold pyridoxal phosphate-dependent enzyme [Actinomycetes bacterium]|nr:aminotransferase class I/II-fold pyridoxal phosphate-dependent enzyme [Actinomycetes bacterium]